MELYKCNKCGFTFNESDKDFTNYERLGLTEPEATCPECGSYDIVDNDNDLVV